jgi:aminoglycoside 6'-N-acetyltransferase I
MTIRPVEARDVAAWRRMRSRLWPDIDPADDAAETEAILGDARWAAIVAEEGGELVGFIEAHLRDYAEGCVSSPVGFIEGWYIEPAFRLRGVGRRLVAAAEDWARSQGCTEMASDAELDRHDSHRAHEALGYAEVERLVCFRKALV